MSGLGQKSDKFELLEQMTFNGQNAKWLKRHGATRRSRTGDLLITNQLLYQLS